MNKLALGSTPRTSLTLPLRLHLSKEETEKIFTDLVRKVKSDSLRMMGRDTSDLAAFQEIVKMQERLRRLRISL